MKIIDADALKEVIKANHYLLSAKNNSIDYGMFTMGIMQAIDNAPTVSLQDIYQEGHYDGHLEGYTKAIKEERPQAQGEWIEQKNYPFCYVCNKCGYERTHKANFCENCGASMKGGADCMDEDAKQASLPYTYNAPQHDWKCGYPDITRGKEE